MNSILAELESKSIITSDAVARIKRHIVCKNPDIPASRRAVILADALNRVLDQNLSRFGEEHIGRLKRLILEHATKKQRFEILCSDAFQAAVALKESGEAFFDSLEAWLCANLPGQLARDTLVCVVHESHRLMELSPSMNPAEAIAAAEAMIRDGEIDAPITLTDELSAAPTDTPISPADVLSATPMDEPFAFADEPIKLMDAPITPADDLPVAPAFTEVPKSGSASYAANRLKAISRKASAHAEAGESEIASNIEAADNRMKAGKPYLGYLSQVYVAESGYRGRRSKWTRLPAVSAAAAALILLVAGLAFGIGRISNSSINTAGQMASAVQPEYAYEYTALIAEEVAAGQNSLSDMKSLQMKATAYDLSVESCGKKPGDPGYGITCSGTRATVGRTVAVDPEVIPLGSRLMIHFPEEYSHMDGIYVAEDTGRLIKGTSIDIFFGEDVQGSTDVYNAAMAFGVRYVDVWVLDDSDNSW